MSIDSLSTEILQKIYEYASIQDLLHLAQTSKKNYRTFLGRRMPLLEQGMHNSYSPLPSLYKLVLSSEPDKSRKPMGTEVRRNLILNRIIQTPDKPKFTLEIIIKMAQYGKVAERWTEIYPQLRWRFGSNNRRLLRPQEKERLRGAIYHHWTYTTLFHDRAYTQFDPDPPSPTSASDPRLRLLRTFSTIEHIQLSEFLAHIIQLVELDLYPSNFIVQEHYSQRLPARALAKMAWGDGNEHRRLVRDIMKFSPADLLNLIDKTSTKTERVDFLYAQGSHFREAPATLNYGIAAVSMERSIERRKDPVFHSFKGSLFFPSHIPAVPNADLQDENMMFGIIDVPGANACHEFQEWYGNDGSKTGELGKHCVGYTGPLWAGADLVIEDESDVDEDEED
jgi:hypothetical protein